jgi:hypothetical protein
VILRAEPTPLRPTTCSGRNKVHWEGFSLAIPHRGLVPVWGPKACCSDNSPA